MNDLSRDDIASETTKAINRAIKHYEKEPFWFKQTNDTFSTVVGQRSYGSADSVATDIGEIYHAEITISGSDYGMTQKSKKWIEFNNPNASTGEPTVYALWEGKIWLDLVPSAVRTVTVYYTKTYAALSADADTNDWLTYAEDLIEARARWWLCKRKLKMYAQGDQAKAEEMEALAALRDKNEQQSANQRIQPSSF